MSSFSHPEFEARPVPDPDEPTSYLSGRTWGYILVGIAVALAAAGVAIFAFGLEGVARLGLAVIVSIAQFVVMGVSAARLYRHMVPLWSGVTALLVSAVLYPGLMVIAALAVLMSYSGG